MKQQILDALKAKFKGVSDAILNRIADKLSKTINNVEQIATTVEGVTFQQILESYGDSRATEAQKTAIRNYEQKHGLKKNVKIATVQLTDDEKDSHIPAWAQDILDASKKLNERLDKMASYRTKAIRKQLLDTITGRLPNAYKKVYQHICVDNMSDEEFNSLISEINTEVESIMSERNTKSTIFEWTARTL